MNIQEKIQETKVKLEKARFLVSTFEKRLKELEQSLNSKSCSELRTELQSLHLQRSKIMGKAEKVACLFEIAKIDALLTNKIRNMNLDGMGLNQICDATGLDIRDVKSKLNNVMPVSKSLKSGRTYVNSPENLLKLLEDNFPPDLIHLVFNLPSNDMKSEMLKHICSIYKRFYDFQEISVRTGIEVEKIKAALMKHAMEIAKRVDLSPIDLEERTGLSEAEFMSMVKESPIYSLQLKM